MDLLNELNRRTVAIPIMKLGLPFIRNSTMHVCKHCSRIFAKKVELEVHSKSIHGHANSSDGRIAIPPNQTDNEEKSGGKTERTKKIQTSIKNYFTPVDKTNSNETSSSSSSSGLNSAQKYYCKVCGRTLLSQKGFKRHTQYHQSGPRRFKCELCPEKFPFRRDLVRHRRVHSGERIYNQCTLCPRRFINKESLKKHILDHQGIPRPRPHQCPTCGKSFGVKSKLLHHQTLHNPAKAKKFACKNCPKSFYYQFLVNDHTRKMHDGVKEYKCLFCKKLFRNPGTLAMHTRVHTQEKPYSCLFCKSRFSGSSTLGYHMRANHTKENPYQCGICKTSFASMSTLIIHKRVHSGEQPYKCFICSKRFAQGSNLRTHLKTNHLQGKAHTCGICLKQFDQNMIFRRHLVFKHGLVQKNGQNVPLSMDQLPKFTANQDQAKSDEFRPERLIKKLKPKSAERQRSNTCANIATAYFLEMMDSRIT